MLPKRYQIGQSGHTAQDELSLDVLLLFQKSCNRGKSSLQTFADQQITIFSSLSTSTKR